MPRGRRPHADVLTPREWEVLALVSDGLTNEQIGERLGISLAGARYHVSEILSKLGVSTRREAGDWLLAWRSEQAAARRLPAVLPAFAMRPRLPDARWFGRWAARLAIAGGVATMILVGAVTIGRDRRTAPEPAAQPAEPTPVEHVAIDFSQPTLGPRYVTEWTLPDFLYEGRAVGADAGGIESALPEVVAATLAGDAVAVRQAGQPSGAATLHTVPQDPDVPACGLEGLCLWTVPLAPGGAGGEYWAVVSGGWALVPAGSPLAAEQVRMDGAASVFQHFVAVYERRADGSWSGELARAELDDPRGDCCDLAGVSWDGGGRPFYGANDVLAGTDTAWWEFSAAIDDGLARVDWERASEGITSIPRSPGAGGSSSWLAIRGGAVMASFASVFYLLDFDAETATLSVVESNLHRRWGGDLRDLDGDGVPEVLVNQSDAYVFSGASGTEETFVRLLRWQDGRLVEVLLETPAGLPEEAKAGAERALALAGAGFWTDAAETIGEIADGRPQDEDLRWLTRRVQLIALGRLVQVERQNDRGPGNLAAPLLMLAGEYDGVVDLMSGFSPAELFDTAGMRLASSPATFRPEYPLLGNEANGMSALCLDRTATALAVAPERAAVHAVRAWCHALATPPDLAAAEAAMAEATRLAPDDAFYAAALEWLRASGGE